MKRVLCLLICVFTGAALLHAQDKGVVSTSAGATINQGKVYSIRDDELELLTNNLNLPLEITISTNGSFIVGKGRERALSEGQILKSDGWLLSPDGSTEPVFDHVAMGGGNVVVVRDGDPQILSDQMVFPNGLTICPDGSCVYPNFSHARLMEGQMFRLDGTPILSRDTISLKNGQVVVQKEGKLIPLLPTQIIGMNDGTGVRGDGVIMQRDGTQSRLIEGQTLVIAGALVSH